MPKMIRETSTISEAAAAEAKKTGRMVVQHISPGWGSSGFYSTDVLEQAAADKVIPAGTHMYADHPTETEAIERPVRSIKDLMAVTVEDGRIATDADVTTWGADPGAVVSEVQVVPQWRDTLESVWEAIGTSIRGAGTATEGEAEGQTGTIFESIAAPVKSVDFVTRAGRGGKVLALMESAAANNRAIAHGISEATVNDIREGLTQLLRDAYAGEKTYVWIRDFDDTTVWFEVEGGDDNGLYAQSYTETDGVVSVTGDRTEVRVSTTYVPVTRPDSTTTPTTEADQEVTMGKIQIEESVHTELVVKAGRADTLESERDTEKARADKAEATLAEQATAARTDAAVKIIEAQSAAAEMVLPPSDVITLMANLPVKEDALDVAAFTTAVDESIAKKAAASGDGTVGGFGASTTVGAIEAADPWAAIDKHLDISKGA